MEYAAADAVVAVDIFVRLVLGKLIGKTQRNGRQLREWSENMEDIFSESEPQDNNAMVSESQFWKTATSLCQGLVDSAVRISQQHDSVSYIWTKEGRKCFI